MFKYNRKLISIFLILVFTAFAIGGCAAPASSEISVQVASAQKQAIKTNISLSGVLLPQSTVTLSTKLTGQVLAVNCDVGAAVKKRRYADLARYEAAIRAACAGRSSIEAGQCRRQGRQILGIRLFLRRQGGAGAQWIPQRSTMTQPKKPMTAQKRRMIWVGLQPPIWKRLR